MYLPHSISCALNLVKRPNLELAFSCDQTSGQCLRRTRISLHRVSCVAMSMQLGNIFPHVSSSFNHLQSQFHYASQFWTCPTGASQLCRSAMFIPEQPKQLHSFIIYSNIYINISIFHHQSLQLSSYLNYPIKCKRDIR